LEEQVRGLGFKRDITDFVNDEKRCASEADELVVQASLVVCVAQAVDPLRGGRKRDAVAGLARADPECDREMCLAGSRRDGDRLQQLRAMLPTEVRVTRETHPLFGRLLQATTFKRWRGILQLVVTLPDESSGTIAADATNVFGEEAYANGATVLSADGIRHLHTLVGALRSAKSRGQRPQRK
jgi:hypothetical protein